MEGTMNDDHQWTIANETGVRLYHQGQYPAAEHALRQALQAVEHFGPTDPRVAIVLNNLANLRHNQGNLAEAEALYQRALAIREAKYGPHHPLVAQSLNNLAALYRERGKYHEAEEFLQRVLAIAEAVVGPDHWG